MRAKDLMGATNRSHLAYEVASFDGTGGGKWQRKGNVLRRRISEGKNLRRLVRRVLRPSGSDLGKSFTIRVANEMMKLNRMFEIRDTLAVCLPASPQAHLCCCDDRV